MDVGVGGQGFKLVQGKTGTDSAVAGHGIDEDPAEPGDIRQQGIAYRSPDINLHPTIPIYLDT
jgi:hypothetical protein